MTLSPWVLLAANLIILGAFFTRSLSGFGGAALAIPLLSLFLSLSFIIPVECLFEVLLSLILLPRVAKDVDWGSLAYIVAGAMAGSLAGVYLLESTPNETLKTILGIVVILVAASMLRGSAYQGRGVSKKWGLPVGVLGGVMGGMLGPARNNRSISSRPDGMNGVVPVPVKVVTFQIDLSHLFIADG